MRIARLGAAAAAAGVVTLCAAGPAFATGTTPPGGGNGGDIKNDTTSTVKPKVPGQGPIFDVNPKFFYGGDTLTFTVEHCDVKPTIKDVNNLFVTKHAFTKTGQASYAAKEVTRKDLVAGKEYVVIVHCGLSYEKFSTKPQKRPKPTHSPTGNPTTSPTGVPSGAPQTGDGSSNGGGNTGLMVAGAGVVVIGLAGGTFLYSRRRSSAGA